MMENIRVAVLIKLALSLLMPCPTICSSTVVKFLLMIPNREPTGIVPAVNQVLDEINRNVSFLPDHRLEYMLREIECNGTVALENFFDVATDKSVAAVVGCGCSSATEDVAKISHYLNTSVISYASTSVVLNDMSVYQSLYRTVPSDDQLVPALATVMFFNNWTQLTMFTENQPQFTELTNLLQQSLEEQNVTINSTIFRRSATSNYTTFADVVMDSFDAQPHIYLPVASLRIQTLLLCAAFHNRRFYPNYAWILLGDHKTDWWREYYMETNCTDTDMITVLNRSLVLIPYPDDGKYVLEEGDFYNTSEYASDAVRAFAEALHSCVSDIGSGSVVDSCRGTELNWNVAFSGRTGRVRFNQNGSRQSSRSIVKQYQIRDRAITLQSVGVLLESDIIAIGNSTVWPDGVPPDGMPQFVISTFVQTPIVVVYTLLGIIVLVGAAICFIFTLVFRKRKVIKLTSPNLNYILIIAVVVMTITNITYPTNNFIIVSTICTINSFFSSIGYDVVIGIAVVKTWRVFYIFKNPSTHKKTIRDWHLLIVVLLIGVVEILFAVPLLGLALAYDDVMELPSVNEQPSLNEQGVLENFLDIQCGNSVFFSIFFGITIAYKLLLHGIGIVLSLFISNVKVQVLNDSRETVMTIFVTTVIILSGSVGLLSLVLVPPQYGAIVWNITLFLVAIVNLTFTFIPKMVALYKDPKGEKVFQKMQSDVGRSTQSTVDSIDTNENASLKEKISQLERELSQLKNA